jgi:putative chitinase
VITVDDLHNICLFSKLPTLAKYVEPLNSAMVEFDIDNPARETMFLAQVAHESGGFNYTRELATGEAYEGRADLGNNHPGDGVRYKGRGLIQITGRANYQKCGDALGENLIDMPELLEQPELACRSAAWFWKSRGLNEIADSGDFVKITKRINGGTNGLADRQAYLSKAQAVLA